MEGFTEEKPRLHYGWKTTQEYRSLYGFPDFRFRRPQDDKHHNPFYAEQKGEKIMLPVEVMEQCSITLYPMVSTDFNAPEAIHYDTHRADMDTIRKSGMHPYLKELIQWEEDDRYSNALPLDMDDYEQIREINSSDLDWETMPDIRPTVRAQYEAGKKLLENYFLMQQREQAKVQEVLERLVRWHASIQ